MDLVEHGSYILQSTHACKSRNDGNTHSPFSVASSVLEVLEVFASIASYAAWGDVKVTI
jgi:hypothetical protein